MTSYQYTTAEPPARIIQIADTCIDPEKLGQFALDLEPEYRGTVGDDALGGWSGQRPSWQISLALPNATYLLTVVRPIVPNAPLTVVARPTADRAPPVVVDALEPGHTVYVKHMMSQLADLRIDIRRHPDTGETWLLAKHYDSLLLMSAIDRVPEPATLKFCMRGHIFDLSRSGQLVPA